jgi:hypothetical protein
MNTTPQQGTVCAVSFFFFPLIPGLSHFSATPPSPQAKLFQTLALVALSLPMRHHFFSAPHVLSYTLSVGFQLGPNDYLPLSALCSAIKHQPPTACTPKPLAVGAPAHAAPKQHEWHAFFARQLALLCFSV